MGKTLPLLKDNKKEESKAEIQDILDVRASIQDMESDVIDVQIDALQRQKVRVNGDDSKIIEIMPNDLNVSTRMIKSYRELNSMMERVQQELGNLPDNADDFQDEDYDSIMKTLDEINESMKQKIDYIFDYPVSDVLLQGASLWSPKNGVFMYEHIIEELAKLYNNNLSEEFKKMRNNVNKAVSKKRRTASTYHK